MDKNYDDIQGNLQLVVDGIHKGWSTGRELRYKKC